MALYSKQAKRYGIFRLSLVAFLATTMMFCDSLDSPTDNDDEDDNPIVQIQEDSFEANDTWSDASAISRDDTISASIDENEDVDFYRFTTAHPAHSYDKVRISLTADAPELLFHFELYDTLGSKRLEATAGTPGQTLNYTFACPGGTYIFRVSGWHEVVNWDNGSSGEYTAIVENLDLNDDYAPNHTMDSAATISFEQSCDGVIVSRYEDDWFHVANSDSTAWDKFTVELTNVSPELARYIGVYDAAGEKIYGPAGAVTDMPVGTDLTYTFAAKESGFYLRVCGWDNIMHDEYGSTGSYTITVTDNDANDSNEPDDVFADARAIVSFPSGQLSGTIISDAASDNGGDYEFFKVSLAAGKKVEWTIDPSESNTELHYNTYRADEQYMGNADGSDGQTLNGSMNNSSGEDTFFYIKLGAFVGDNGDYTVEFTETTAD